jgi:hypothetical protein
LISAIIATNVFVMLLIYAAKSSIASTLFSQIEAWL